RGGGAGGGGGRKLWWGRKTKPTPLIPPRRSTGTREGRARKFKFSGFAGATQNVCDCELFPLRRIAVHCPALRSSSPLMTTWLSFSGRTTRWITCAGPIRYRTPSPGPVTTMVRDCPATDYTDKRTTAAHDKTSNAEIRAASR